MDFILKTVSNREDGTFGVLMDTTQRCWWLTIERPWKNNDPGISCIPAGTYTCKRIDSPTHGDCFQVMNVPDRDMIEIHSANLASQLKGCIALGKEYGEVNGTPAIMDSKKAIGEFMAKQAGIYEFTLTVVR